MCQHWPQLLTARHAHRGLQPTTHPSVQQVTLAPTRPMNNLENTRATRTSRSNNFQMVASVFRRCASQTSVVGGGCALANLSRAPGAHEWRRTDRIFQDDTVSDFLDATSDDFYVVANPLKRPLYACPAVTSSSSPTDLLNTRAPAVQVPAAPLQVAASASNVVAGCAAQDVAQDTVMSRDADGTEPFSVRTR